MRFGVQLYSLREEIKTQGLEKILQWIADAGYDCVEFAGFYGLGVEEIKALLEKYELEGFSAHIGVDWIEESLPYIDRLGIKRVYIPWENPQTQEEKDTLIEKIRKVKPLLDERGVVFGYHNHDHEYADGKDLVWELMSAVDGFTSELDIFWATVAERNPLELMEKYGERLSALHVKELDSRTEKDAREYPNAIVGEGKSQCKECIEKALEMGIEVFILEVEGFPCEVSEYLKKSCANMKKFAEAA